MLIKTTIEGVGEKSIELKEIPSTPKLKVHFQRHPDYKGEYGFDWFRDYYETKLADQSKLQALKDEYTPCQILGEDYFVPWLTLMPDAAADLILKVELDEAVKIKKNAPGKIILPNHSGLIFSPSEIELSALRDKQEFEVNVSCRGILAADAKLDVTIDTDNQVVGKLNVLKNSVVPKINLRFVKVVVYPGQKHLKENELVDGAFVDQEYDSEEAYLDNVLTNHDVPNFIKTRAFNQALIDVDIDPGNYVIELDGTTLANEGKIRGYEISDNLFAKGLHKDLLAKYQNVYENTSGSKNQQGGKSLIVFYSALQRVAMSGTVGGESSLLDVGSRSCLIYAAGLDAPATYVHELGHVMGCLHSFVDSAAVNIIEEGIKAKEEFMNRCFSAIEHNKKQLAIVSSGTNPLKTQKVIESIEKLSSQIADSIGAVSCYSHKIAGNAMAFDNFKTSSNFMDYTAGGGIDFFKWQWATMQNAILGY